MSPRARRAAALGLAALLTPCAARAGCPSVLAGSCFVVDGGTAHGSSSASAYGRSVRCSARCRFTGGATILLRDDGSYLLPPTITRYECRGGTALDVPDEEGAVVERRGSLVLEPKDLTPFDAFLDACVGRDVVIRRYRTTLRLAADGATLSGVAKLRTVTRGKVPVVSRAVQRFTASRAATVRPALAPPASDRARELPACSPDLALRCVTD